jgi:hypothetical protein
MKSAGTAKYTVNFYGWVIRPGRLVELEPTEA